MVASVSSAARTDGEQPMSEHPLRKIAFILAATEHGTMIVNRFDHHTDPEGRGFESASRS